MLVDEVLDRRGVHAVMLHHVQDDAGIDRPAARSHHQAVDRGEPHGRRDAAAVLHRAQARAVAQVSEDDPPVGKLRRELLQARSEELVGEAVKSIAANAFLREAPRQGERLRQIGLGAMEGRVEAGDLRYLRRGHHDRTDGGEVMRLMQGRERLEFGEVVEHGLGHPHRRGVVETPVDHAMTEGDNRPSFEQRAPVLNDLACGGAVVEAFRG